MYCCSIANTHTNSKACNALHDNQLLQIFLILISDWYANCGSRSIFFSILVLSLYDQLNWSNPLLVYKLLGFDIFSFSFCVRSVWSFNSECSKNYADERDERMKNTHTLKLRTFTRLAFIKRHKSFILVAWPIDWSSINFPLFQSQTYSIDVGFFSFCFFWSYIFQCVFIFSHFIIA